jgi:hypothetical protein
MTTTFPCELSPTWRLLAAQLKKAQLMCEWERLADAPTSLERLARHNNELRDSGGVPGPMVELSVTRGLLLNGMQSRDFDAVVGLVRMHPASAPTHLRLVVGGKLVGGVITLGAERGAFAFAHDARFVVPQICLTYHTVKYIDTDADIDAPGRDVVMDMSIGVVSAHIDNDGRRLLARQGAHTADGSVRYEYGILSLVNGGMGGGMGSMGNGVVLPDMMLLSKRERDDTCEMGVSPKRRLLSVHSDDTTLQ